MNHLRTGVLIFGLASVASTSIGQMFKPSAAEQIKAGQEYAVKIRNENKVLPDSDPRVQLLRKIGNDLLRTRTPKEQAEPWKFTFDVIDSKEVNAFAVPGGPIFFFSGLIDRMKTVEELAGVMGHEIIHIRRQHWASAVNSSMERQAGIVFLGSLFGMSRQTMEIAAIVDQFAVDLPANRGQEKESDTFGMEMVVRGGYNPRGMVDVFKMFQQLKGSNGAPEWLSTHPDDKNRISKLESMVRDYQNKGRIPKNLPALTPLPFETQAMRDAKNPPKPTTKPGTAGKKTTSKKQKVAG